jgi:hypothetical protein
MTGMGCTSPADAHPTDGRGSVPDAAGFSETPLHQ